MTGVRKTCPMNGLQCKREGCGWFCDDDGLCAIAIIPTTLDWMAKIAATQPFYRQPEEETVELPRYQP